MLSFIIPVYGSAKILPDLYCRITDLNIVGHEAYEIIFVEDCGDDNAWEVIQRLADDDPRVRGVKFSRNYGQHNALLCGIRLARGDVIVTMDDDLQHPPEEVSKLLSKLEEGFDVVYGAPHYERHGFLRGLASQITKYALKGAMGIENARQVSAYRVFRTRLRDAFKEYRSPSVNIDVLLTWGTKHFSAVRVQHELRKCGTSGYTARKLVRHALNMTTGFSTRPLQIASLLGFVFSCFGFVVLAYVLVTWLLEGSVMPGFAFLASIISIFSGAQLLALGILGEYLARMHLRTMDRPPFFVRDRTDRDVDE